MSNDVTGLDMDGSQPCILLDIGGTHIRFGMTGKVKGGVSHTEKYPVASYDSLLEALDYYVARFDVPLEHIKIATAAWPYEEGVWRFAHEGRWDISIPELHKEGWTVLSVENDFVASAKGTCFIDADHMVPIRGTIQAYPDCGRFIVIGPGTGLGIAVMDYDHPQETGVPAIRQTFGGHMNAPMRTAEQREIAGLIHDMMYKTAGENSVPLIAEHIVSGPGLDNVFKACCVQEGHNPAPLFDLDYILATRESPLTQKALRLFHEFLGLTLHQAMMFNHSFDGVYLDGGVTQHLMDHKLFMAESVIENMGQNHVGVVQSALDAVPLVAIKDPYIALRGLQIK